MRIYFTSMTLPKKAAKRIYKHYSTSWSGDSYQLSDAQNFTALMLGYADWHELDQVTKSGKHDPSELDENSSPEEQESRIRYQSQMLGRLLPLTEPILRELALKWRVSAGNPLSESFADDGYRKNALIYWEPPGEKPEWRFRPSRRSNESREELYDLQEAWADGLINLGDHKDKLDRIISDQPENLAAYLALLGAFEDLEMWPLCAPYLLDLEAAILKAIPPNYPMRKKVPHLNWGSIENRDYLRCLYYLARGFYIERDYAKAKQWFLFLKRCSGKSLGIEELYLRDLRLPEPVGAVYKMEIEL